MHGGCCMLTYHPSYDGGTFEESTPLQPFNLERELYIQEQSSIAWKRYYDKVAEIKRIPTMPYYSIFGSQAELQADLQKAETIAFRLFDRIVNRFGFNN